MISPVPEPLIRLDPEACRKFLPANVPEPVVDLPANEPGKPPVATVDGPTATPSVETCRQLLAQIRTMGASAPTANFSKTAGGAEMARDAAAAIIPPALAALLVLAGGILLLAWLRSIPGRPARE